MRENIDESIETQLLCINDPITNGSIHSINIEVQDQLYEYLINETTSQNVLDDNNLAIYFKLKQTDSVIDDNSFF
jgi:hypothetical protein